MVITDQSSSPFKKRLNIILIISGDLDDDSLIDGGGGRHDRDRDENDYCDRDDDQEYNRDDDLYHHH